MARPVGVWYAGDTTQALRLAIADEDGEPWGTAMTGSYTPTLEVREPGGIATTVSVTGTWEDGTEAAALFLLGNVAELQPEAPVKEKAWECVLKLTDDSNASVQGSGFTQEPFQIIIRRWP